MLFRDPQCQLSQQFCLAFFFTTVKNIYYILSHSCGRILRTNTALQLVLSFTYRGRGKLLSTLQSIPSSTSSSKLHPFFHPAQWPGPTCHRCCPSVAPSGWWQEGARRPEYANKRCSQWPAGGDTQRSALMHQLIQFMVDKSSHCDIFAVYWAPQQIIFKVWLVDHWLMLTVSCDCGLQASNWGRFRSSESRKRPRNGSPQEMMWPPSCQDALLWSTATQRKSPNQRTRTGLTKGTRGKKPVLVSCQLLNKIRKSHCYVKDDWQCCSVSLFNFNWLHLTWSFS